MNVCFMCARDYHCMAVDKRITSQVENLLPEITIIKLGIPLRICPVCHAALYSFNKFKQASVDTSRRLEATMKGRKSSGVPGAPTTTKNDKTTCEDSDNLVEPLSEEKQPMENTDCKNEHSTLEEEREELLSDEEQSMENASCKNEEQYVMDAESVTDSVDDGEGDKRTESSSGEEKSKTLQCMICNKEFFKSYNLKRHMKSHLEDTFQCYLCSKIYKNKHYLISHIKQKHMQTRERVCSICNKKFETNYLLRKHQKSHGIQPDFECDICKKNFATYSSLNFHIKNNCTTPKVDISVSVSEFDCCVCTEKFSQKRGLTEHLKTHFKLEEQTVMIDGIEKLKCPICYLLFDSAANFMAHLEIHCPVRYLCSKCDRWFRRKDMFLTHTVTHLRNDYTCHVCKETIMYKVRLEDHMKTHNL